ncbi:MAG TPA: prolyl oligopeptidase family serine peptidase [Myxococcaceae bacterium]|nr:prolyl oligopeptidase family serine peptidase [Myxococcaceae bacterium]
MEPVTLSPVPPRPRLPAGPGAKGPAAEQSPAKGAPTHGAKPIPSQRSSFDAPTTPSSAKLLHRPLYPSTPSAGSLYLIGNTLHQDPYLWLEKQRSPEVGAWVDAQNALAARVLRNLPERAAIRADLERIYSTPSQGPVTYYGKTGFQFRKGPAAEHSRFYVVDDGGGPERILLDPNTWEHGPNTRLANVAVSPDGAKIVYQVAYNNSDSCTLHVMDVRTGQRMPLEEILGTQSDVVWDSEGKGFFYVRNRLESGGGAELSYHSLGTSVSDDDVIADGYYELHRAGPFLALRTVTTLDPLVDVISVIPRTKPDEHTAKIELVRGADTEFNDITEAKGQVLMVAHDTSNRGRVIGMRPDATGPRTWDEIVPPAQDAVLQSMRAVGERLVLSYLKDGAHQLKVCNLDGSDMKEIPLPAGGLVRFAEVEEGRDRLRLLLSGFTHPNEYLELDPQSGTLTSLSQENPEFFDPARYKVERVAYPAKDGTEVSLTLVRRRDLPEGVARPTLLYGYGGYNIPETLDYEPRLLPWIDRGGVYALAHIRGGGEEGKQWHRQAMRENKQVAVDDLLSAAEHLIREGFTEPSKLAIQGGSNGGLVVGAAITQRPELFRAALVDVPLLDLVRYAEMDGGPNIEFGDPSNPKHLEALTALSPYERLSDSQVYPAVLFTTSDTDNRCPPAHAWKMAAAMQQETQTQGPVLVRTMERGAHWGSAKVSEQLDHRADQYAFLLNELGGPSHGSSTSADSSPTLWQTPKDPEPVYKTT